MKDKALPQLFPVSLDVDDQITSTICGHIVVEIIKFVVYQKLLIPYTYERLKYVINKKKCKETNSVPTKESLFSVNHFRLACGALENLDFIFKNLLAELNSPVMPKEVCLLLGATPVTCKEVYRIRLPSMCHKPQCLSISSSRGHRLGLEVLRMLATSEVLDEMIRAPLPRTNMYVLVNKQVTDISANSLVNPQHFILSSGCRVPKKTKVAVIDLSKQSRDKFTCCNEFQIFDDLGENSTDSDLSDALMSPDRRGNVHEIKSSGTQQWYQSSAILKGFNDYCINGSSITNIWAQT